MNSEPNQWCRCGEHSPEQVTLHSLEIARRIAEILRKKNTLEHEELLKEIKDRPPWQDV